MILHIANKSPTDNNSLLDCLQHCADTDSILLIEDAVLAADHSSPLAKQLAKKTVYALSADVEARGLSNRLQTSIKLVDDAGFVELTVQHSSSISWY